MSRNFPRRKWGKGSLRNCTKVEKLRCNEWWQEAHWGQCAGCGGCLCALAHTRRGEDVGDDEEWWLSSCSRLGLELRWLEGQCSMGIRNAKGNINGFIAALSLKILKSLLDSSLFFSCSYLSILILAWFSLNCLFFCISVTPRCRQQALHAWIITPTNL